MKKSINILILSLLVLTFANGAFAHEASKHKEMATKPNCEAMKNMDMSKMESDDPIMQAMMKKCASASQEHVDMGETLTDKKGMSECTAEHAKMGHCKMSEEHVDVGDTVTDKATSECTAEHAKMGHCKMIDETEKKKGDHEEH